MHIYIADGTVGRKGHKRVQIDFIPSRFTSDETSILFGHIKSILKNRVYKQFISKARYKRVDVAFNMPGVFQPFVFPAHYDIDNVSVGACWPKDGLVETTYLGHRNSQHYIIYDKILKELKSDVRLYELDRRDVKNTIVMLAMTTRIERRFYTSRAKYKSDFYQRTLPLSELATQSMPLDEIAILDPVELLNVNKELLLNALYDKSGWHGNDKPRTAIHKLNRQLINSKTFQLDNAVFNTMKTKLLSELFESIQNPKLIKTGVLANLFKFNGLRKKIELPLPYKDSAKVSTAYKSQYENVVLESGAGCGKTNEIVKRVVWLICSKGVSAKKITLLAYTKDAVKELRNRISINLKEQDRKKVTDLPKIETFSAWCGQQLKKYVDKKYDDYTYLSADKNDTSNKTRLKYINEIVSSNSKIKTKAKDLDDLFSFSTNNCKPDLASLILKNDLKIEVKYAIAVRKAYQKRKTDERLWDFDDVLTLMNKQLKASKFAKRLSKSCEHLILDEMQDSNLVQWQILNRLSKSGVKLFCVGDTAQSIFGFRGASPDMLENHATSENVKRYVSKHSYRSTSRILRLTNFVRYYTESTPKTLTTSNVLGYKPRMLDHDNVQELVNYLCSELIHLTNLPIDFKSIFILTRTNSLANKINNAIGKALENKGRELFLSNITVMTMHKSKGLEADICYVVDPRYSRSSYDTRAEYLRLIYVALSRARKRLVICRRNTSVNFYTDGAEDEPDIINIMKENTYLFSESGKSD